MEIKIDKKLCTFEKGNDFKPDQWKISFSQQSKYADYCFFYSNRYFLRKNNYNCLTGDENFTIVCQKEKNREPGKRYARIKLTMAELKNEFGEHEKLFNKENLPLALAYFYEYDYCGKIEFDREEKFAIGRMDEKWFWLGDDEKKLISAKNFKIICLLNDEEKIDIENDLKKLEALELKLYYLNDFNGIIDEIKDLDIRGVEELKEPLSIFLQTAVDLKTSLEAKKKEIKEKLFNREVDFLGCETKNTKLLRKTATEKVANRKTQEKNKDNVKTVKTIKTAQK